VTDEDSILAVAEMMTPVVHSPYRPRHERAKSDDLSESVLGATYIPSSNRHPYAAEDVPEDVDEDTQSLAPSRYRYNPVDSDVEDYSDMETGYSRRVSLPSFDLPRRSMSTTPDTMAASPHRLSASSDTPSLISSRGSSRGSLSSQFSPLTPSTSQFPFSNSDNGHPLSVIEERYQEDLDYTNGIQSEEDDDFEIQIVSRISPMMKSKTLPSRTIPPSPTVVVTNSSTFERKAPPAKLSIPNVFKSVSPDTLTPQSASFLSVPSTPSTPSTISTPSGPTTALGRLFGGSKKDISATSQKSPKSASFSEKSFKAELKKAKKEEQRLKVEMLAIKLKENSKKRAEAVDQESIRSQEKRKKEPVVSMYGDGQAMFM
jgi:hypothetical protein